MEDSKRPIGRPSKLDENTKEAISKLFYEKHMPVRDIAKELGISYGTVTYYLAKFQIQNQAFRNEGRLL